MKEKLRILMQNENLSASRLAEMLEIKPAGVSHILSGRNNPSFELICKIVNRFPQINPYWLLGDAEQMYNAAAGGDGRSAVQNDASREDSLGSGVFAHQAEVTSSTTLRTDTGATEQMADIARVVGSSAGIERVIVVYADKSFEAFTPRK